MRCRSCNAHLSIDDEKCPFCGTPNPDAVKHRQDMRRFSGEFHRTKSSVLKVSRENAQKYVRIMMICVMAVLVLVAFFVMGRSWDIASAIQESDAEKNYEPYSLLLDEYEAEGDALSFASFFDEHSLYMVEDYDKYQHYYRAASNYESAYYQILTFLEETPEERSSSGTLDYLCDNLDYYYSYLEQERYSFYEETGMYDEIHLQAVDALTDRLETLLKFSFSLSDEDMVNFRNLSNAEKQVLIERSVREHE